MYLTTLNPESDNSKFSNAWNIVQLIAKCRGEIAEVLVVVSIDNFGSHTMEEPPLFDCAVVGCAVVG